MFARVATLFTVLFFVMFAAASAVARTEPPPTTQCSTGTIQCCNSVQQAGSPAVGFLQALLGLVLGPITGQVGLTCNPLSIIGVGGNSCNAQTVCCTGNSFSGGLIVLGCSPININL